MPSRFSRLSKYLAGSWRRLIFPRPFAIILGVSKRTVDKHRENLFAKLVVETRTAAVAAWHDATRLAAGREE